MPKIVLTKSEAITELLTYDHCFITTKKAQELAEPFGYDAERCAYTATDTRSEFKGLTLPGNAKEGDKARGVDADSLAEALCLFKGLTFKTMMGRGFRLQECCRVLKESLSSEGN